MGGMLPAIKATTPLGGIICYGFNLVTDKNWSMFLENQKRESKEIEEMRLKAMHGKVSTNQIFPAEYILMKRGKK